MQIPIMAGIYASADADFRTCYPSNLVPVPLPQGISQGYLRPADGLTVFATSPGADRGGINWNGTMYRVSGTSLVSVSAAGAVTVLGDVGGTGMVTLDYSFDRLAIASGGRLFYWDGAKLTQVTDPDLGSVIDMLWIDGYFMTTDGTSLVVTELNDPTSVSPLKYGSSEADPDRIVALVKLRGEVCAFNRYTIEVFSDVGGSVFPFSRVSGALVQRGAIGTFACSLFLSSIAFLGSGRNEAPAVWLMQSGDVLKLSTREIDLQLRDYSEEELSAVVMEARVDKGHQHLLMHLPDQTWVYDGIASQVIGDPVWFRLTSSIRDKCQYLARNLVWCYDRWLVGHPLSGAIGELVTTTSTHYGTTVGWEFSTQIIYNEGHGAIVHALELVGLTGRTDLGIDPTIWTSYSLDGVTWSQERGISAGKQGDRAKRLQWRSQGHMRNFRLQRFRGTSDFRGSFAQLEVTAEPLNA